MAEHVEYPEWSDYLARLEPVGKRLVEKIRTPDDPLARQEAIEARAGKAGGNRPRA